MAPGTSRADEPPVALGVEPGPGLVDLTGRVLGLPAGLLRGCGGLNGDQPLMPGHPVEGSEAPGCLTRRPVHAPQHADQVNRAGGSAASAPKRPSCSDTPRQPCPSSVPPPRTRPAPSLPDRERSKSAGGGRTSPMRTVAHRPHRYVRRSLPTPPAARGQSRAAHARTLGPSVRAPGPPAVVRRSLSPSMSASGVLVAFGSFAANLVAGDTNGAPDVFVARPSPER